MSPLAAQPHRRRAAALCLIGTACLGSLAFAQPVFAARYDTSLVSLGPFGETGDDASSWPSISADGRYVAFQSAASNLGPDGMGGIFVRDLATGVTTLVSRASGIDGAPGNDLSSAPSISADGRYVAFQSVATNLGSDANTAPDVFVRDRLTHTTVLASTGLPFLYATEPAISGDGRSVAFTITETDTPPMLSSVNVRDLRTGELDAVSVVDGTASTPGNDSSTQPAVSGSGRYVAFASHASNLTGAPDGNDASDVFVRDRQTNTTTLVSRAAGAAGALGDGGSEWPSISADGRQVAFASTAANLGPDANATDDVFLRNLDTSTTTLASRATGAGGAAGDAYSYAPSLSSDARHVAFFSGASNLGADANDTPDVFVRDLQSSTTVLASRATGLGAAGNGESRVPSIATGGQVAFQSDASNLGADANATTDVFVRDPFGAAPVAGPEPQLTGSALVGGQLTCATGTWDGLVPVVLARQWTLDGAAIAGQTGAVYTVTADDLGHRIACTVTATDAIGRATAVSTPVVFPVPAATHGPAGQQGPQGPQGPAGPQGPPAGNVLASPARLFAALWPAKVTARVGRRVSFRFVTSSVGTARVEIRRRSKTVATITAKTTAGRNIVRWNGKVGKHSAAAGAYTARLTATNTGGAVATDTIKLQLTR